MIPIPSPSQIFISKCNQIIFLYLKKRNYSLFFNQHMMKFYTDQHTLQSTRKKEKLKIKNKIKTRNRKNLDKSLVHSLTRSYRERERAGKL